MENNTDLRQTTLNFLTAAEQLTGVIASVSSEGKPHATVVYYYIDDQFDFYFLTATNTQKYTNLCTNPTAAYSVGSGPEHTTVQGSGPATLIAKDSDEEKIAIAHIYDRMREYDTSWPVFQLDQFETETIAVFKITTDSLHILNLEPTSELPLTTGELQQVI